MVVRAGLGGLKFDASKPSLAAVKRFAVTAVRGQSHSDSAGGRVGVAVGRGGPWIPRWDRHSRGTGGPQVAHQGAADTSRAKPGLRARPTANRTVHSAGVPHTARAPQTTARCHGLAEKIKTTADSADESFLCVQAQLHVAHHLVNTLDGAAKNAPILGQDQEVIHVPDIADASVAHQLLHFPGRFALDPMPGQACLFTAVQFGFWHH